MGFYMWKIFKNKRKNEKEDKYVVKCNGKDVFTGVMDLQRM